MPRRACSRRYPRNSDQSSAWLPSGGTARTGRSPRRHSGTGPVMTAALATTFTTVVSPCLHEPGTPRPPAAQRGVHNQTCNGRSPRTPAVNRCAPTGLPDSPGQRPRLTAAVPRLIAHRYQGRADGQGTVRIRRVMARIRNVMAGTPYCGGVSIPGSFAVRMTCGVILCEIHRMSRSAPILPSGEPNGSEEAARSPERGQRPEGAA
jgi:hypothetical protein